VIRLATSADRAMVESIVRDAYSIYLDRMDKPPGPMLDDYATLIGDGAVSVLNDASGIRAVIVLLPQVDHLLLDNIAVRPDSQGIGLGRRLIAFAEAEAQRLGFAEVRLYLTKRWPKTSRSTRGSVLSKPGADAKAGTIACS
jgi:GNAT superfamily N-acetyltransferase